MDNKILVGIKNIIIFVFLIFSSVVFAEEVTGKIEITYTSTLLASPDARGYTELKIAEQTLAYPCGWLFIHPDDKNTLSVLLSAQSREKIITIHYSPSLSSPWSANSCGIVTVIVR